MKSRPTRRRRSGNILVLTAFMMIAMIGMLAFAIDIGYLTLIRTQLQSSADSAALAATWELLENQNPATESYSEQTLSLARDTASRFARLNLVGGVAPALNHDDVVFGRLNTQAGQNAVLTFNNPSSYNASRVRVSRTENVNGEVPLFFARALGINTCPSEAEATAAFIDNFSGFRIPSVGPGTVAVLPFAIDKQSWDALIAGGCGDSWTWDEESLQITQHFGIRVFLNDEARRGVPEKYRAQPLMDRSLLHQRDHL